MIVIGAGLAGLIAAHTFPKAQVFEARPAEEISHKALLRFRSPDVGNYLGVEFKPVRVRKGIWHEAEFHEPNIMLANMYARKVIGRLADRSIWSTETVTRYIAPEDLIPRLVDKLDSRITWSTAVQPDEHKGEQIVSTMPMNAMAKLLDIEHVPEFNYAPINVERYRLSGASVYQTIYFPSLDINLYRASITGDLLILEFKGAPTPECRSSACKAFGINAAALERVDTSSQRFGKIAPVDELWRRNFIFDLTMTHKIYSLGRFATWRNILLDDVLHDAFVVKKLMEGDNYKLSVSR